MRESDDEQTDSDEGLHEDSLEAAEKVQQTKRNVKVKNAKSS